MTVGADSIRPVQAVHKEKNMPICYIIGAGEDCGLDFVPKAGDLVIAADGGYAKVKKAGIVPHLVIGDFDSLGKAPEGEDVITLPTVKDVTDTWAAMEIGIGRGFREFHLYGCTGGRFEHTMANLQTLAALAAEGMRGYLYSPKQVITAIGPGTVEFDGSHRGFLSVFAHTDRCTGVCLRGLKYTLENGELTNTFPLGVSNEFLGGPSSVTMGSGVAILVYDRQFV